MPIDRTIRTVQPQNISPLLMEMNDPPRILYMQGNFPHTDKYLTIVGSRKYSEYGKSVCESLIEGLAGYSITIISGLALGMDAITHRAALKYHIQTIAVPGSGLDDAFLYPSSHRGLRDSILEADGCILSEFSPTYKATPYGFPQRNRIMAGLSHAVLVIEAEEKSGTLITSKYATDYNRDVCTIPHSIYSPTSEGPHMLIRLGATLIRKPEDILDVFNIPVRTGLFKQGSASAPEPTNSHITDSPIEKEILLLLTTPRSRDEICTLLDAPIHIIQTTLSILEIRGYIEEKMGKISLSTQLA